MKYYEFSYDQEFKTESGVTLNGINIAFHTNIPINQVSNHPYITKDNKKPIIWICHALTANSDPEEWWNTLVGKGLFFDTDKYNIVCANMLGSCYGTTGPQSINPDTNKPYLFDFPIITVRDMIKAHEILSKYLGINHIDLLIGGSSGGFQAVEWSISNPDFIKKLVLIATNAIVSPWCTALNEAQRMSMRVDKEFISGQNPNAGQEALEAARSIAITSYRSYEGYKLTQYEKDTDFLVANRANTYQQHQGKKLAKRFNPYSYWYLTRMIDTQNVGRARGGVKSALAQITAKTLCIAIKSDVLFPVVELETLNQYIKGSHLEIIDSNFGHDGFLLEHAKISKLIIQYIIS